MKFARILTLCGTLTLILIAATAMAVVPDMINYQGRLTDSGGNPVDTTVAMTFSICVDSTGMACIWGETQDSVVVTNGLFNVKLGADSALTDDVFGGDNLWLHVKVGFLPIEPPTELLTAPYAFHVSTVDGASGGVISGEVTVQDSLIVTGDLRVTGDIIGSTPWTTFPFATGYDDYEDGHPGSGQQRVQYRKIGDIVYMRGIIHKEDHTPIPPGVIFGWLPEGFRPPAEMGFPVGTYGNFHVKPSGEVGSIGGSTAEFMFFNVSFSTSP
jgi:hypothetical protein